MKILILNYEFPPLGGGAGVVSRDLAEHYSSKGHEVLILTSHYKKLPFIETEAYTIIRIPALRKSHDRSSFIQMLAYIFSALPISIFISLFWKPTVVHTHFLVPTGIINVVLKKLFGLPFIVTLHGGDIPSFVPNETGKVFKLIKPFATLIGKNAYSVLGVSKDLADMAKLDYASFANKIDFVNNGIIPLDKLTISRSNTPTFIFAGRLTPQKRLSFTLQAFSQLEHDFELNIFGDGPLLNQLKDEASSLGLEEKVKFWGWVETQKVIEEMRKSHFLLLVSEKEGLSISGLQAFNNGLPIIGTKVTGLKGFIQDEINGFLIDESDLATYISLLDKICEAPNKFNYMSENCRKTIQNEYNFKKSADRYLELLTLAENLSRT